MRYIKKILTIIPIGRILSVAVMVFLLSFLTVGNAFIYSAKKCAIEKKAAAEKEDDGSTKRAMSSEEEKSSSRSILSSLSEEYLHEHDHFMHLYITVTGLQHQYLHPHGYGDDHSSLDCPPPDCA